MSVGNASGGALRIRIEHHHAVAQLVGGNDEKAAQLTTAQHAQRRRWQDHGTNA
jgi:hypothetical protein